MLYRRKPSLLYTACYLAMSGIAWYGFLNAELVAGMADAGRAVAVAASCHRQWWGCTRWRWPLVLQGDALPLGKISWTVFICIFWEGLNVRDTVVATQWNQRKEISFQQLVPLRHNQKQFTHQLARGSVKMPLSGWWWCRLSDLQISS